MTASQRLNARRRPVAVDVVTFDVRASVLLQLNGRKFGNGDVTFYERQRRHRCEVPLNTFLWIFTENSQTLNEILPHLLTSV